MKVGIFGSGFGIYGYLPAFINLGIEVWTPDRYIEKMAKRTELHKYLSTVCERSDKQILSNCEILVIAQRPEDQLKLLTQLKNSSQKLFLEKPIAKNYKDYLKAIELLESNSKKFAIAYLFEFQNWFKSIKNYAATGAEAEIEIIWNVGLVKDNWKYQSENGGGLLKYYGIHFVYILNLLNIIHVEFLTGENTFQLISNNSNFKIHIKVQTISNLDFKVYINKKQIFCDQTPFGSSGRPGVIDNRIESLMQYIESNISSDFSNSFKYLEFEKQFASYLEQFD